MGDDGTSVADNLPPLVDEKVLRARRVMSMEVAVYGGVLHEVIGVREAGRPGRHRRRGWHRRRLILEEVWIGVSEKRWKDELKSRGKRRVDARVRQALSYGVS